MSSLLAVLVVATLTIGGCSDAASSDRPVDPYPESAETREWSNPYAVVLDQYLLVLYGSLEVSRVDLIVCSGSADAQANVRNFQKSGATVALLLDTVGRPDGGDLDFGVAVASAAGDISNTKESVELSATATFREEASGPRGLCLSSLRVDGTVAALPGVDVAALNFQRP